MYCRLRLKSDDWSVRSGRRAVMGDGPGHTEATPSLSDNDNHVHPFVSTLPLPYRAEWLHDLPRILFSLLTNNYYCSLVAVAVLLFLLQRWRNRNLPPGPWGIPFYGNLNYLLHLPHLQLSHLREVYGDVYSFKAGCRRIVVLCSFEAIMEGLVYKKDALSCRPELDSYNSLYQGGRQCGRQDVVCSLRIQKSSTCLSYSYLPGTTIAYDRFKKNYYL